MKIGIIGSSFSCGEHWYRDSNGNNIDKQVLSFTHYLGKEMPEYEFINLAAPAVGSERYLECITYLKYTHDVDFILIENIEDRSVQSLVIRENDLKIFIKDVCSKKIDPHKVSKKLIAEPKRYVRSVTTNDADEYGYYKDLPKSKVKVWKEVISLIYNNSHATQAKGIVNVDLSIKLCEMLDIQYAVWSMRSGSNFVNQTYWSIHEWLTKKMKQNVEDTLCDTKHLNDYWYERAAKDYWKPLIKNTLENNNDSQKD